MKRTVLLLVASLAAVCVRAQAADPESIARDGTDAVAACSSCHGPRGEGQGTFPRLAAQDAGYLLAQLEDFASGQRASPIMAPVAEALSATERKAMADWYARQPAPKSGATPPADPAGRMLATRGAWSKGLPACIQCHGPGGRGVGAAFPAIAAQPAPYLVAQLRAFREATRRNDPQALMRTPASKLTDAEIEAVSAWFAAQLAVGGARP